MNDNILLHTPIFDVVKGPEVQPNFHPVQVKSPDWVTIIVENSRTEFLMEKQFRYGLMKECEEFPCGMVEKDEHPRDAALRELKEETGLDPKKFDMQYLGKFAANPAFMTNYMHYFYIKLKDGADFDLDKRDLDEHEKITVFWKDKYDAYESYLDSQYSAIMAGAWLYLKEEQIV